MTGRELRLDVYAGIPFSDRLCRRCKYYLTPEQMRNIRYADCELKVPATNCTNKKLAYHDSIEDTSDSGDGVLYWDCEGHMAHIRVQPDFGCRHWEEREDKDGN